MNLPTVLGPLSETCVIYLEKYSAFSNNIEFFSPDECRLKWKLELTVEH